MTAAGLRICLEKIEARWQSAGDLFSTSDFSQNLAAMRTSLLRIDNDADGIRIVEKALADFAGVPKTSIIAGMVERVLSADTRRFPAEAQKPAAKAPQNREQRQAPVYRPPLPTPPQAPPGVKALLLAQGMEAEFEKMHPGEEIPAFIREKVARAQARVNQHREAA